MHCPIELAVLDRLKRIGSLVNPRNPRFDRQTRGAGSRVQLDSRRSINSKAIWPSIRASAAPKQKCAPHPNARCGCHSA